MRTDPVRHAIGRATVASLAMLLLLGPAGASAPNARSQVQAALPAAEAAHLDLQKRLSDLRIERRAGETEVVIDTPDGPQRLSPQEFLQALERAQSEQHRHGWLYVVLNITTPWGILWVGIGLLGQVLFTFRMVLQWLVSEKHKRSVVPVGFWWGSLFGGLMLFVYFTWRKDIVGILGQSTGVFVYARNLILIHRARAAHAPVPAPAPAPSTIHGAAPHGT
jgi:lipid-A-disaccharide synthase-like uncharacterized protein